MIWHKSLDASPFGGIDSDCIYGIRFRECEGSDSLVSVIGVYLSHLNLGLEYYQEQLVDLGV